MDGWALLQAMAVRRQAIAETNAYLLSGGSSETNSIEIGNEIKQYSTLQIHRENVVCLMSAILFEFHFVKPYSAEVVNVPWFIGVAFHSNTSLFIYIYLSLRPYMYVNRTLWCINRKQQTRWTV